MLKILVFGYSISVRSSRKLNRLLERDVAFQYLTANQQPDFRTISLFRKDHRKEFEHLFEVVLCLCREAGLADLGEVALDANRTREMLQEKIQDILDEAAKIDAEEDEEYGQRWSPLP